MIDTLLLGPLATKKDICPFNRLRPFANVMGQTVIRKEMVLLSKVIFTQRIA